jgi:NADH-quinone oxidoreductase subunit M
MAIAFLVVTLSSVALPGTNGFVGEFTILLGTFQVAPMVATLSGVGVVLGAVYSLRAYQMVMLGPLTKHENKSIDDLSCREILAMVAIAVLVFGIGFFPQCFFGKSQVTLDYYMTNLLSHIGR